MRCPFCSNEDSQVKDSRPSEDNTSIRRRRFCEKCGSRFTTYEKSEIDLKLLSKFNSEYISSDKIKILYLLTTELISCKLLQIWTLLD